MKRIIDLAGALIGVVLLFPVFAICAFLVRRNLGAPIFFRQERAGKNGEPFEMVKFRSMRNLLDENGNVLPDEKRLTNFGKFLRSSSLDELPELWNVLRGDMSLVGPRPLLLEYLPLYTPEQMRRHNVRPGITGWAQVNGRNAVDWERKFELDVWYVDHQSIGLDARIICLTVLKVLARDGISAAGEATMSKFEGGSR